MLGRRKEWNVMDDGWKGPGEAKALWKPAQVYVMAGICLLIGLAVGYFARGSASPAAQVASSDAAVPPAQAASAAAQQRMPTLDEMKQMADKQAAPLLAKLKTDPNNADLLNQVGTVYRLTHQFHTAIDYYQKSLAINPKNVGARTDMASCMYYLGDVDGALAELNKSLTYDPKHAGTLINLGIIEWKGKNDADGAIAAWQKLLKLNPNFENKEMVERLIVEAKQQKNGAGITGVKG
jgi:tetratricopeptide (TPR) repeat protein